MCALRAADLLLKPSAPLARQRGCPAIAHRCGFGADVSNGNELEQGFGELLSCDCRLASEAFWAFGAAAGVPSRSIALWVRRRSSQ